MFDDGTEFCHRMSYVAMKRKERDDFLDRACRPGEIVKRAAIIRAFYRGKWHGVAV